MRFSITPAIVLITAMTLPLPGQSASAPIHPPTPSIKVLDSQTRAPLAQVQVRDAFSGTSATTDAAGTLTLGFLTFRGTAAVVELRKLGYQSAHLLVNRDDTLPIVAMMEPLATLAPVITSGRYRLDLDAGRWEGFEQRCQAKSVTCVRPEELEKRSTENLADVLVHADGVTIGTCGGGRSRAARCGKISMHPLTVPPEYCAPSIFVDGFRWSAGGAIDVTPGTPPQAPFTPTNVKAVEVYPPYVMRPLRFEGDPLCGAIAIWTK